MGLYKKQVTSSFSLFIFLLFSFLLAPVSSHSEEINFNEIRKSFVHLEISSIYYDPLKPWIKKSKPSFLSIGLVMPGKRILALANDLRNSSLIEVSQYTTSYSKVLAKVVHVDYEANLALLSVDSPNFFTRLKPFEFGQRQGLGEW